MSRHVRLREFLLGVKGVALLRHLFTGDDETAQRRTDEVRRIAGEDEQATFGLGIDVPALDVATGYARWSTTYDQPGNPLISVEQPIVWSLLDAATAGVALDAACGTGRHAARLAERGHQVTGVDATAEMLAQARARLPGANFREGDLNALPLEGSSFDLVVCALALDHVEDLASPLAEFARVVRPGGRLIISDIHPTLSALGGAAFFRDAGGRSGFVRGYRHSHAAYLEAFAAVGLIANRCIEGSFGEVEARMQEPAASIVPEATLAAYLDLPAVLVWDLERPPAI